MLEFLGILFAVFVIGPFVAHLLFILVAAICYSLEKKQ